MNYVYGPFGMKESTLSSLEGEELIVLKIVGAGWVSAESGRKDIYLILRNYHGTERYFVIGGEEASRHFMDNVHAEYPIHGINHLIGLLVVSIMGPNQQGVGVISLGGMNVLHWPPQTNNPSGSGEEEEEAER
ncbi:MAG: hypothetical protein PHT54_04765 [Candidatus Nanoarchaeia archaeon]|nr:hypothetical protein [Candidatus Nanoarchaeia archaeon]